MSRFEAPQIQTFSSHEYLTEYLKNDQYWEAIACVLVLPNFVAFVQKIKAFITKIFVGAVKPRHRYLTSV